MVQDQQFRCVANIFLPLTLSITAFEGHSKIIEIEMTKWVKNKENKGPFKKGMKRIISISCTDEVFQGMNMTGISIYENR